MPIATLAIVYKKQLETKRIYDAMEVGVPYAQKDIAAIHGAAYIDSYINELLRVGLITKKLEIRKFHNKNIYRRISDAPYETMDFNTRVSMARTRRTEDVKMPEIPSELLNMMGYTDFKPPEGRKIEESHSYSTAKAAPFSNVGSSLEMVA